MCLQVVAREQSGSENRDKFRYIEEQEEKVKQLRGFVFALKPNATAADVQWELSNLFPERANPIQ